MDLPPRRRGRPRVIVTEAVAEARRQAARLRDSQRRNRATTVETPLRRKRIDNKKTTFANGNTKLDIGNPDQFCGFCTARVWLAEFTGRHMGSGPKGYTICCGKGKVLLPLLQQVPPELGVLLTGHSAREKHFQQNSRMYNTIFALCSFGGKVDNDINRGSGPYVFRVCDLTYHSMGSLVPPDGYAPKFAQLYMYDGQEAIEHRMRFPRTGTSLDAGIVGILQQMLTRVNALVRIFKQLWERFPISSQIPVRLRLLERRSTDGRFVNIPGGNDNEFAALALDNNLVDNRDIVVEYKQGGLKDITELHPSFMSLQYPLLFPRGEDGYRLGIRHRNIQDSEPRQRNTVSSREYQAFRVQHRDSKGHALLMGGRLFLQYVVDSWCCIERGRLQWVKLNQSTIRSDLYNNIVDSVSRGDILASDVGKRIVLPSSFTGGFRHMQQNFQDSIALCKEYGHPDLFITFTCNPKWPEIRRAVVGQDCKDASVRPDLIARVFKIKLDALMTDLTKNNVLVRVLAAVYTVEFQKRGLPHAHIVLWLAEADKLLSPEAIDTIISAEILDKDTDPLAFEIVSQLMMHGPCGEANPKCPCMTNGKCMKHYPRMFCNNTTMDQNGYAPYRRRNTGRMVEANNGIHLDNRHVVPYNRGLLVKYQAHINVERCNRSQSIKYLFKYIRKGPDTVTAVMELAGGSTSAERVGSSTVNSGDIDEVKNYLSCRYVSAAESCWRIFEFPIHHRDPFVQRLYFHLDGEQEVRFRDDETLPEIVSGVNRDDTMLVQWLISNRRDESGRDLTYVKYPTKFRWDSGGKFWARRRQNVSVVGRMVYAHPSSGERFYMRMLLNLVTGAQSFEDIRTVEGIVYPTYKEACFHRGLLDSDKEWHLALSDASIYATAPHLRELFVTMLVFCEVSNPSKLWNDHWIVLSDDMEYIQRKLIGLPSLILNESDKKALALEALEELLTQYGKSLSSYPGLPEIDSTSTFKFKNQLLLEEMLYNCHQLKVQAEHRLQCLNQMQREIFDKVIGSVAEGHGGMYFVYGHGGTGKTFLWSTIISKLRSEGRIVLAVASSGIASLLIEGGRTAHSCFKIPIDINETSTCEIKKGTHLAELICKTSFIVWDEAPMTHRYIFEAVDRTFRDIRQGVNPAADSLPFGGLTVLLGGDFRQVLPVVPKEGRQVIVGASVSKSYLWRECTLLRLVENMRIEENVPPITIDDKVIDFKDWMLSIGDGIMQTYALLDDDVEATWIKIPKEVRVMHSGDPIKAIADEIYSDLHHNHGNIEYLRDKAILTPLNESVDKINREIMSRLPGNSKVYKSCDTICKGSSTYGSDEILYPPEYLNTLKFSGMPNHELELKEGVPIMLLRNLNPKKGLCNGTRLIVTRCYNFLLEGLIITGNKIGEKTYIPRITMSPADKSVPFVVKRLQFPVAVCYAMTINKSQGQTVKSVGLYLPNPVFSHGQLYVAVSRVTSPLGLKIVCVDDDEACTGYTKNIVYHEIFNDLLY